MRKQRSILFWKITATDLAILFALLFMIAMTACTIPAKEVHNIKSLRIVYASHQQINQEVRKHGIVKKVSGFYNSSTNTIWCEKKDYHTCGHELRHAIGEKWHD